MMFTSLDASSYSHSGSFYNAEFESILSKIVVCYNLMIQDRVVLQNNENAIRDVLVNDYINNPVIKRQIDFRYIINPEVPQALTTGRPDIKIQPPDPFVEREAYFTIECKRLNNTNVAGATGLNAHYIQNGMCRFIDRTYSSYHRANGMIGFVVEQMDINQNIAVINQLLSDTFSAQSNTTQPLNNRDLDGFNYCYCSTHTNDDGELSIYHLMLDVSGNIAP